MKTSSVNHEIKSIIKNEYSSNNEYNILLKSENHSPIQVELNVNKLTKEITLLGKKTITTKEDSSSILLSKAQPKPHELVLSPVEQ